MPFKYPCIECARPVKSNNKAVLCVACLNWIHLSCSELDNDFFESTADWICDKCILRELPFSEWIETNEVSQTCQSPVDIPYQYNSCESIFQNLNSLRGLKIGHLNVCSLLKNFEEVENMLVNNHFDIFTMCETRLSKDIRDAEIEISGYDVIRLDRNRQGGGIILYIRNAIVHSIISEFVCDIEILCINVNLKSQKPLCLVVWYRPPDAPIKCFEEFENILQFLDAKSIDFI